MKQCLGKTKLTGLRGQLAADHSASVVVSPAISAIELIMFPGPMTLSVLTAVSAGCVSYLNVTQTIKRLDLAPKYSIPTQTCL